MTAQSNRRVAVLLDESLAREGLARVLNSFGLVAAQCADVLQFAASLEHVRPNACIVDLHGRDPEKSAEAVELAKVSEVPVVGLRRQHAPLAEKLQNAVMNILDWESTSGAELSVVLERLIETAQPMAAAGIERVTISSRVDALTKRQREVLGGIGRGEDNLKIAAALGLSESAVRAQVSRLYKTLDQETRIELARIAWRCGL